MENLIQAEIWPFQVQVTDDGGIALYKHDVDSGAVGEIRFYNNVHGDVEIEVRRFDEAAFGSVRVTVV